MFRTAPVLIILLLTGPIVLGLSMVVLPAFGYLPALNATEFTLAHWQDLFAVPGLVRSLGISLMAGLLTPILSLSLVFLYLATASDSWMDRWIRRLVSPLLAVPHAAAAFGLAFLIAPSGLLSRLVSPWLTGWQRPPDLLIINDTYGISLMLGLVIKEIPFLLLMALAALPQLDVQRRVAMARSLGYRPGLAWMKTVAPALYPLLRLPVFAVIAFASSTVDVAIILGPSLPGTLSVMVLGWFSDPDLAHRFLAAAGALLQLGLSLTAILIWMLLESVARRYNTHWLESGQRDHGEKLIWLLGRGGVSLATVLTAGSLISLLFNAFAGFWRFPASLPDSLVLRHWQSALPSLGQPLFNTVIISLLATALALVLVLAALENEHRHHLKTKSSIWFLYLPLLVPQVAFLFGLVVFTESLQWQPGLPLVIFAHLIFVLPYVFLTLSEAYRRLDPRWSQLAATLGASPNRSFLRIRLPMLLSAWLTAAAIGAAISISQFLPTQLLGAGRVPTITTEAVALASGGNRNIISVWAMMQALLPMLGFMLALSVPRFLWRNRQTMRYLH